MHIAILGGAFDPPHIGHLLVARQVSEVFLVDEIWLMPCPQYFPEFPVKFSRISSYEHRYKMASLLVSDKIKISDFEKKHNPQGRTIDTLQKLNTIHPQDSFTWVIGSDQIKTFHLWNDWKRIIKEYSLIIFPRDTNFETLEDRVKKHFELDKIPPHITVLEDPEIIVSNVSSSLIRKRMRKGLSINGFVLPEVEQYIRDHNLYSLK